MKQVTKIIIISIAILQGALLSAQNLITIRGRVVTFGEIPVNKAEVTTKKTNIKVFTDSLGFFSIDCHEKDKIYVNAHGFDQASLKLKKYINTKINLIYSNKETSFDEAVEHGHIAEEVLQKAISTYAPKGDKDYSLYTNIYELIDSEIFNVNVVGSSVTTQKQTSFTQSQEVLLVVNGIIVSDISFVLPVNVKSIVYVDGPDAAKYGSQGGNGAIEIILK